LFGGRQTEKKREKKPDDGTGRSFSPSSFRSQQGREEGVVEKTSAVWRKAEHGVEEEDEHYHHTMKATRGSGEESKSGGKRDEKEENRRLPTLEFSSEFSSEISALPTTPRRGNDHVAESPGGTSISPARPG
jgi:hypothetical protein